MSFEELFDSDEPLDFADTTADLVSQPITGYLADGSNRHINLPLISHIVDNLYVGGHDDYVDLTDKFSHVFSLYVWGKPYQSAEGTVHQAWTMYDSHGRIEARDADENAVDLGEIVYQIVSALNKGGNVLVHCQAGINRSNLLSALVLRAWKNMTSLEAIALLRERRGDIVLANRTFEVYLKSLDADS